MVRWISFDCSNGSFSPWKHVHWPLRSKWPWLKVNRGQQCIFGGTHRKLTIGFQLCVFVCLKMYAMYIQALLPFRNFKNSLISSSAYHPVYLSICRATQSHSRPFQSLIRGILYIFLYIELRKNMYIAEGHKSKERIIILRMSARYTIVLG